MKSEVELRNLGFPEEIIRESVQAEERGLFDMEPSHDLVERTIARCRDFMRVPRTAERESKADSVFKAIAARALAAQKAEADLSQALRELPFSAALQDGLLGLNRLPVDWLAVASLMKQKELRPLMMVDNHNVINPSWWESDSGLRSLRSACRVVNTFAQENGTPPASVLMVLRPNLDTYTKDDFVAIGELVNSTSSDLWMITHQNAGPYQQRDVIVVGQDRVLTLQGKFANPGDAFVAFREEDDSSVAIEVRGNIEQATQEAVPIKPLGSKMRKWEDTRTLVKSVMEKSSKFTPIVGR
jgi:hypothetical protein